MPVYSVEERESLTQRAMDLKARNWTYTAIAEELAVTRQTVKKWIESEYAKRSEHRSVSDAREVAISRYEMLFKECLERLDSLGKDSRSLNASGYINSARSCQERIDKLTGAEAPLKHQEVEDEYEVIWEDIDPSEIYAEDSAE